MKDVNINNKYDSESEFLLFGPKNKKYYLEKKINYFNFK